MIAKKKVHLIVCIEMYVIFLTDISMPQELALKSTHTNKNGLTTMTINC